MNVAVVGSRDWTDGWLIHRVLDDVFAHITTDVTVISGGARGADTMGVDWAKHTLGPYVEHLPDWDRYGKSAGYRRNGLIVADADLVLAFQHQGSRGTQHSIDLAHAAGVPVIVFAS